MGTLLAHTKKFPALWITSDIYVVLSSTFLMRFGYFMIWPYLTILLANKFSLTDASIGAIFFISTMLASLGSLYVSYMSDIYGRKPVLLAGLQLSLLCFLLMPYTSHAVTAAIYIAGVSLGRSIIEFSSKAYISDSLHNQPKVMALCQSCRYYIANIGVAAGSFVGVSLGTINSSVTFSVTALLYLICSVLSVYFIKNGISEKNQNPANIFSFLKEMYMLLKNKRFSFFVFCCVFLMMLYSTFNTTLTQYLMRMGIKDLEKTISSIVSTNSLIIIAFQLPVILLIAPLRPFVRISLGIILITAAQLGYAISNPYILWQLIFTTCLLSLGEIVAMPSINVEIDRIAPANRRGLAFGMTNLISFGRSLSPLVGGVLLQVYGGRIMFLTMFAIGCLLFILYAKINRDYK